MKSLRTVLRLLLILVLCAALGLALIFAVYALPSERIGKNVAASTEVFRTESNYPKLIPGHFNTTLDNWTDAVILAEAVYDGGSLAERALLVPHLTVCNENEAESLVRLYGDGENCATDTVTYGRYWHGYMLLIRPLLLLTDYAGIRELTGFLQLLLFGAVLLLLAKRRRELVLPLVLVYALLNPAAVSMTINYSTMFFIIFFQLLVILRHDRFYADRTHWVFHFMLVGCLTSYFDFLTYPLAGFGVAMLLLLALYPDTVRNDLTETVRCGVVWGVGYVGMWASKWLIGTALTGRNILREAAETVAFRVNGDVEEELTGLRLMLGAVRKNLSAGKLVLGFTALLVILSLVYALVKRRRIELPRTLLLCAFAAAPLAWYMFAANHSFMHYFFTYRTLSISVFAAAIFAVNNAEFGMMNAE